LLNLCSSFLLSSCLNISCLEALLSFCQRHNKWILATGTKSKKLLFLIRIYAPLQIEFESYFMEFSVLLTNGLKNKTSITLFATALLLFTEERLPFLLSYLSLFLCPKITLFLSSAIRLISCSFVIHFSCLPVSLSLKNCVI